MTEKELIAKRGNVIEEFQIKKITNLKKAIERLKKKKTSCSKNSDFTNKRGFFVAVVKERNVSNSVRE